MMVSNYSQYCNDKLFKIFPEFLNDPEYSKIIRNAFEIGKECAEDSPEIGDTSAHDIYEHVLCDFVLKLVKKPDKESHNNLTKALGLVEEIANHEDFNIRNVVDVSFVEPFTCYIKPMKDVEKYLGPKSLEMAREIAHERYGRNPNTWEKE